VSETVEDPEKKTADVVDPKRLLVDWANNQDGWVRRLVGQVMASHRPISDEQTAELFERYLAEKGLRGESPEAEPSLAYRTDATAEADVLRLVRLSEVAGVNALSPGAVIDFFPGLTILYGENGTGKTGYARILKRLAAVRVPEEIVPNIHTSSSRQMPTAKIDFQVGGVDAALTWNNEVGVSPFTRMSIFDSPAVNLRVDDDLSYVFTPAEISLFGYVSAGIRAVQERGNQAVREMTASSNPFLRYFRRGSTIYQQVEALGPATDVQDLSELAVLPTNASEEKTRLEREIAALRSNAAAGLLAGHREAVRTLHGLNNLAETVARFDRDQYNDQVTALTATRESYRQVREETFGPGDLPGPADDEWQRFVTSAAQYQDHLGSTDYPHTGDQCIYCRQHLDPTAIARIRKYASFLDDALARQISDRERTVAAHAAVITSLRLDDQVTAIARQREAEAADEVYDVAERLLEVLAIVREPLAIGQQVSADDLPRLVHQVRTGMGAPLAAHEAEVEALTQQLSDREAALRDAETKLVALTAKIELDRHLPEIRTFVQRAKQAANLDLVLKRMSGLLRSLTEVSKIASEDLINHDFQSRFEEECRALRTPEVRLEFVGRQGKAHRRKTLAADYRLSQILSEGEQKVLALADFLAEARMGSSSAPIIFDDPVNSLDHRRLKEVSDRITALVATRQVVVFTHNIWLATELLARFEKRPSECSYYMVSDDEATGAKGKIDRATGPRWDTVKELKKRVDEHLKDAAAASGASQAALVESAYGEMRSWCEVVVEGVLFGDVTRRYRANVMMGGLRDVHPDRLQAAIDVIDSLFNRACRYIPDHSQPLPTLSARPTLADAQADWTTAQEAVKAYRG
jgi:AAA domain-containing protein